MPSRSPGPGEALTVRSLGTAAKLWDGPIGTVSLLGHGGPLPHTRTADALTVELPHQAAGKHAFVFQITA